MPYLDALLRRLSTSLVLALSAVVLLVAPAVAGPDSSRPAGLTHRQEQVVLSLIDDICGDTWCEGDFAFRFRQFSCDPASRTCTLGLRIAPYADPSHFRWRSGQLRGFVRFPQLVTTSATGQRSLDSTFYEAVSELIARMEASV